MAQVTTQNNKPVQTGVQALSGFLNSDAVKNKFAQILGQKANGFIASVLSLVNSNQSLANADQNSIYMAAMVAASLDLPINQNLGLAYIVPYNQRQADGSYKQVAQFQLGYRGFKQLAQRSGQFIILNDTDVREGEIINHNRLSGEINFDWIQDTNKRLSTKVIGYVSYFKLVNGFESTFYMSVEEIEVHAKKYSQTYKKYGTGLWKDEFDGMAKKTVTKLNLSKNAPLSIEMQRAVVSDQAVINNFDPNSENTLDVEAEYVDNNQNQVSQQQMIAEKEYDRISEHIEKSTTIEQLSQVEQVLRDDNQIIAYDDKKKALEMVLKNAKA
ncbi:recombinase RecT [Myroides odoratus]